MNEKVENSLAGGPFGAVEQPSKNSGGGGNEAPSRVAAGQRNLAWNCPTVTILHLGRGTASSPSNTIFPNPETIDYDFVERS